MISVNELNKQILQLAQEGLSRRRFLEELSVLILDFSGSDAIEIRLADTDLPYVWNFDTGGTKEFKAAEFIVSKSNQFIPVMKLSSVEERLCLDLFQQRYNPEIKYFYQKRSILVSDSRLSYRYNLEGEKGLNDITGYNSLLYLSFITSGDINGLLILKKEESEYFSADDVIYYENLASSSGIAIAFRRSQFALQERIKELYCLHAMNKLLQEDDLRKKDLAYRLLELITSSFQNPEHTSCLLLLDNEEYHSENFRSSSRKIMRNIIIEGEKSGRIEVYLSPKPEVDFLPEEMELLDSIASTTAAIYRKLKFEEERKVMREQLRHADRLATIGQLAAGIAHELNEPLANVLGYAELMEQELSAGSTAGSDLKKIINSALHARDVVRKLLFFTRQMPASLRTLTLNEIICESVQFLEGRIRKNNIEIRLELEESLPEITGDSSQLKQVLINLIVNAQQAMPEGGIIKITSTFTKENVVLKIRDNGIGMSGSILKKIYLPFFTTKQPEEGTGLGLSVVYGIVNSHGGKIRVRSELEKGTQFSVYFPRKKTGKGNAK